MLKIWALPSVFNISLGTWNMLIHEIPCLIPALMSDEQILKKFHKSKLEYIFMYDKIFYGKFKYFFSILGPEADFLTNTYI